MRTCERNERRMLICGGNLELEPSTQTKWTLAKYFSKITLQTLATHSRWIWGKGQTFRSRFFHRWFRGEAAFFSPSFGLFNIRTLVLAALEVCRVQQISFAR